MADPAHTEDPIEPPDDAAAIYLAQIARLQAHVDDMQARVDAVVSENWRLLAAKVALAAPPPAWLALKPAAVDAGVAYETARHWCAMGWVESYKQGGRVIANLSSLIACRVRLTGR
jgi:hypothetical protein